MNPLEFGKLIKAARIEKGYTQTQLANLLSVSVSAISKWENGKNLPDHQILTSIGDILSLSIDEMYHPTRAKKKPSRTKMLFLLIAILAALFITCFIILQVFWSNSGENICQVAFRTTIDETCGEVYEVACLADSKSLDSIHLEHPFVTTLSEIWIADTNVPAEIHIMKVSFYTNEKEALSFGTPQKSIYLVR